MDVLAVLSRFYGVDLNWFFAPVPSFSGLRYRQLRSKVRAQEAQAFEATCQVWLQGYRRLEEYLNKPLRSHISWKDVLASSPSATADIVRKLTNTTENKPVPQVVDIIRMFGIRAIEFDIKCGIDGLAAQLNGEPVMILNRNVSNDRYRLDAAHELGHHLLGHCEADSPLESRDADEEAYEFAFYLLMPREELRRALKGFSMRRLLQYKLKFGVSLASMIYRGHREGFIPETVARKVWKEFSRRGLRKKEPGQVSPDRPSRFEQLVEYALMNACSWKEITSVTGIRSNELKEQLERSFSAYGVHENSDQTEKDTEPFRFRLVY